MLLEKQKLIDISIALTSETNINRLLSRIVTRTPSINRRPGREPLSYR